MRKLVYLEDIPIDITTNRETLALIGNWLDTGVKSRQIVTLNALIFLSGLRNSVLKKIIQDADLVTVDGYGIESALHQRGYFNIQRFTGADLSRNLLNIASDLQLPVYFFGGTTQVAQNLRRNLPRVWPNLVINGIQNGYGSIKTRSEIFQEIIHQQPGLLLAGLGSPQQELFLAEILPYLKKTVGIGVGGTLEILSGLRREAPLLIRNQGWEWCFRMLQQPSKLKHLPDLIRFWYRYLW